MLSINGYYSNKRQDFCQGGIFDVLIVPFQILILVLSGELLKCLTETNAKWTFFVILFYYLRCTTFSDDLPTKALGIVPHDVKELPRQCIVKYLTIVVISLVNMVGI